MLRRMWNRLPLIVFALSMILARPVSAQESARFKRLNIEDGLSQSSVEAIVQDDLGFMWIGTEDGLNRYDGYGFTTFRHDPDDPGSLADNNIWCLHVDHHGYLWVGTLSGGLDRFDPTTETFTHYVRDPSDPHSISSNRIRSLAEDGEGNLWIGTREGASCLSAATGRFTQLRHDPGRDDGLPSDNVRFVYPDSAGTLWIATNRGFCSYDIERGEYTRFPAKSVWLTGGFFFWMNYRNFTAMYWKFCVSHWRMDPSPFRGLRPA